MEALQLTRENIVPFCTESSNNQTFSAQWSSPKISLNDGFSPYISQPMLLRNKIAFLLQLNFYQIFTKKNVDKKSFEKKHFML